MSNPAAATTEGLAARVATLEAIESIIALKNRYAEAVDRCSGTPVPGAAETAASLFTEDAHADYAQFGKFDGRAKILEFFQAVFPAVSLWSRHVMLNPILEVTGDTATGRWYCEAYVVFRENPAAGPQKSWVRYEDTYVLTPEGWRFKKVIVIFDTPTTA
ncbi:MAG: nuclear transport factor 2 family protein [Polyangiaceae bacterium]